MVLHGDDMVRSRQRATEIIQTVRSPALTIIRATIKKPQDALALMHQPQDTLFAETVGYCFDNLLSATFATKQKELITQVITALEQQPWCICWEGKTLSPTQLKQLTAFQIAAFPITNTLFQLLESLRPQPTPHHQTQTLHLLQTTLQHHDVHLLFAMLVRHFRQLLIVKTGAQTIDNIHPYARSKLTTQATSFTVPQLTTAVQKLATLEQQLKSSHLGLSLEQSLALFFLEL